MILLFLAQVAAAEPLRVLLAGDALAPADGARSGPLVEGEDVGLLCPDEEPRALVGDLVLSAGVVEPLRCLVSVSGDLTLQGAEPDMLYQLDAIARVGGTLKVAGDTGALDLLYLPALAQVGGLHLSYSRDLVEVDLPALERIGGALVAEQSPQLVALTLPALEAVDDQLSVEKCPALTLLSMPALVGVGGSLTVSHNRALEKVRLGALQAIGRTLRVDDSPALALLSLPRLESAGSIEVSEADALTRFGLGRLRSLMRLSLSRMAALETLDGLGDVVTPLDLRLRDLPALVRLSALGHATASRIELVDLPALRSTRGLRGAEVVASITVSGAPALSSIGGLEAITAVEDDLILRDVGLTDLSGLSGLMAVGGTLRIEASTDLADLSGLENLREVGRLRLVDNIALESLSGLSALHTIRSQLALLGNEVLSDLSDLSGLRSLDGSLDIIGNLSLTGLGRQLAPAGTVLTALDIKDNAVLRDLDGLAGLSGVAERIRLQGNPALASTAGLAGVTRRPERVELSDNLALADLSGLPLPAPGGALLLGTSGPVTDLGPLQRPVLDHGVTLQRCSVEAVGLLRTVERIDAKLTVTECPDLTDLAPLERLEHVGEIDIIGNPRLASLSGLSLAYADADTAIAIWDNPRLVSLESLAPVGVGRLSIEGNGALTDLSGLEELLSVHSTLSISGNGALTSLSGLDFVERIGKLHVTDSDALGSLSDLMRLESIEADLVLANNPSLAALTGLEKITALSGQLIISGNHALTTLHGLDALVHVGAVVSLSDNAHLTSLAGLQGLREVGRVSVFDNPALRSVEALGGLTAVDRTLEVFDNPCLRGAARGLASVPMKERLRRVEDGERCPE